QGDPGRVNYRAAKAGVVALMKSVAMAGEGGAFRCNAIAPVANTRMTEASNMIMKGGPEDVAPMAVYLMSAASAPLNGQIFTVDADRIATWQDPVEQRMVFAASRWTQAELAEQVPWLFEDTAHRMVMRGEAADPG
ncbi:MAG: SDR family oxidoreductase, partial [Candidatus Nanopelagicales bacterium]